MSASSDVAGADATCDIGSRDARAAAEAAARAAAGVATTVVAAIRTPEAPSPPFNEKYYVVSCARRYVPLTRCATTSNRLDTYSELVTIPPSLASGRHTAFVEV